MNKHDVQAGQVWKDNDVRTRERTFRVARVDLDYYPGGRAECTLLGEIKKGQRQVFYARLDRFNGTKRGYSLVENCDGSAPVKKKAKKKAKKAKKKKVKKARGKK